MYKPVILLGNGVRRNPRLVERLANGTIPVLTTWMGIDLLPEDAPAFCGRPGVYGQRAANIIQQKADALYILGARLDDSQVAYSYKQFAPRAIKMVYDVDPAELDKFGVRGTNWEDLNWDLKQRDLTNSDIQFCGIHSPAWLAWCKKLYARFRPELEGMEDCAFVDPFHFISLLSDYCQPGEVIALGSSGGAPNTFLQAFKVKRGQRISNVSTIGAMGADIPMAIGSCIASGKRTICVTGDGGFMLNVQELELVRRYRLPVQFFVYSNNGYGSIRSMQDGRFNGRRVACDPGSGLTLTPLADIARCYGLTYEGVYSLNHKADFHGQIVELFVDPEWVQYPKVMSSVVNGASCPDDMADMTPRLPREELDLIMEYGNE